MKSGIKTGAALLAALGLLVGLGGCGTEEAVAQQSSAVAEIIRATAVPAETAEASETAEAALIAAENCRDLFEPAYDPGTIHLGLPSEILAQMKVRLAGADCVAVDAARLRPVVNGMLLADFVQAVEAGEPAALVIYELCSDGGFIRHRLEQTEQGLWVSQTRLAWKETEPFIGYDERYEVTALSCADGLFRYEYFMPDNPPGSNHDGHIDTVVEISLA